MRENPNRFVSVLQRSKIGVALLSSHKSEVHPLEIDNDNSCSYEHYLLFKNLASALKDNTKSLRLENVKIEGTNDDMQRLFSCVRGHPSLESFHAINVSTVDPTVTLDLIVSSLLVSAQRIQTVHIESTPIQASTIASVVYSDTVQSLSIPMNGYKDADASLIADALMSSPPSLHSVDLSGNELSDVGGQYLERFVENNTGIRSLCLNGNKNMSGDRCAKISAKLVGRTALAA
ncbi:hypothetical protein ACA910_014053 [Epithemia clementina (nom. ined.)]